MLQSVAGNLAGFYDAVADEMSHPGHGSLAPVRTLERVLSDAGIRVPQAVIRRDMGLAKLDHITRLLEEPEVIAAWKAARRTTGACSRIPSTN